MFSQAEHQQSTGMAPLATRGTFTAFGARHITGVAVGRWVVAVCFVIAAVVLLALGQWWGALYFLPAALNGALAYLVPRWNRHRYTSNNARRPA